MTAAGVMEWNDDSTVNNAAVNHMQCLSEEHQQGGTVKIKSKTLTNLP